MYAIVLAYTMLFLYFKYGLLNNRFGMDKFPNGSLIVQVSLE